MTTALIAAGQNGQDAPPTDLVPRAAQPLAPVPFASLVPRSVEEAVVYAKYFAHSGLFAAKTVESAFTLLLTGMELGLGPAQSMRGIYIVEGKPSLSADTLVALCLRRPDVCLYFSPVSSSDAEAVFETHRNGAPAPVRTGYTIDDAKRAGLLGKPNWQKVPAQMLLARCKAKLARMVYADLTFGLYTPDELREGAVYEGEFGEGDAGEALETDMDIRAGQVAAITAVIKASKRDPILAARVAAAWYDVAGDARKFSEMQGDMFAPLLDAVVRATEGFTEGSTETAAGEVPEPVQEATFRDEVAAKAGVEKAGAALDADEAEDDPFAPSPEEAAQYDAARKAAARPAK